MKKRCEYVIIHNIHQSHSTHMNFCKTWDLRQYVDGGKCVSGRTTGGSRASPVGREKECPRYCCPFVIRSFPHLTDTPVFEIRTGNCLLKTTSSSGYVVLGRGLQENNKKKGQLPRPPSLSLAHFNHVFKVGLTSPTSNGRLAYVKRGRDGD